MASFRDLKQKLLKNEEKPQVQPQNIEENKTFELEEARYMLNLIANSDFKGRDVQTVYNIALKLQEILKSTQE